MRHPGIDGQRLVGVGGCVAQELALGRDRQESRRHRNPKEREGENAGAVEEGGEVDGIERGRCVEGVVVVRLRKGGGGGGGGRDWTQFAQLACLLACYVCRDALSLSLRGIECVRVPTLAAP